jgi:glutamyl-tRNA reductase
MPVLSLGVSHRHAPVELLERLAFTDEDMPKAYRRLSDAESVAEAVVLSTCNRVEVYAVVSSYHEGFLALKRFLAESRDVTPEEFAEPLDGHYEDHAAEHLFAVAAGLDSMVLGEPQILSQVRAAYRRAESEGATGAVLGAMFRAAVRTGRRVRAETGIGASPAAFVEAGVRLAESELGDLSGRPAAVIGAGQMAALAVRVLREHEVAPIRIVNRNAERALALAARSGPGAKAHGLGSLPSVLRDAEVVVSCTGAAGMVVRAADIGRRTAPLFVLDLAVPRDVEPEVGGLPGVRLADVDDLRAALGQAGEAAGAVEAAQAIVAEEVARFAVWRRSNRLAPLIRALQDRGEAVLAAELARTAPRLRDLSQQQHDAVEALARRVVAKLLHDPIARVKDLTAPGLGDGHARALADLFGLDIPDRSDRGSP